MIKICFYSSPDRYHLIEAFGWGIFIQKLECCPENTYHDHPFSCFAILEQPYLEQKLGDPVRRLIKRFNWISARGFHRIELLNKPNRELVFHGPAINPQTSKIVREYIWTSHGGEPETFTISVRDEKRVGGAAEANRG